jgi:hypothetical protein
MHASEQEIGFSETIKAEETWRWLCKAIIHSGSCIIASLCSIFNARAQASFGAGCIADSNMQFNGGRAQTFKCRIAQDGQDVDDGQSCKPQAGKCLKHRERDT